ncbi:PAS domain-containing protein [Phenylobacterium sp.]|uniref:sensor histidine kinase n=1 Tax=Phenylobacterium sp. TaxID=1871053 RepID=UPI001227CD80|nr:PAS domain-containing protein [Phenylobacterium sp.]THD51744.1 MAG: PAS domain S-box protein [Phenylobacterium sp.]
MRSAADATALGMAFLLETRGGGSRRFLFTGPRCQAVNGVTGAAVMADASVLYDMILPEHRVAFAAAQAEAEAQLEPFDVEVAMRRADGQVRWHRFAALPRPQPDGAILWDGLQIDVTDRRSMAAALVEQRRRLEVAVEATGLGFWEWDIPARKVTWSERNKALYGLPPDAELTVERYLSLVHPDDIEQVRAAFVGARDKPDGGDYSLEQRIITPDGEIRWVLVNARVANDASGEARLVVGTSLDITERKAAEERLNLQMGELAHRAKNGIAILMAIVSQTARGQETVEGFLDLIMSRLQAMSSSQDLVTAAGGHPVALSDVIAQALTPFGLARVDVDPAIGAVTLRGEMAIGMGLLLHEMATNAVKYGALSNSRGRVIIAPEAAPEGQSAFAWRENGGPEITQPNPPGFGTRLLQMVLRPQGGEVKFSFEPAGFRAHVEFPTVR